MFFVSVMGSSATHAGCCWIPSATSRVRAGVRWLIKTQVRRRRLRQFLLGFLPVCGRA